LQQSLPRHQLRAKTAVRVTADAREHERATRFGNRPFTMPDECAGKIAAKRDVNRLVCRGAVAALAFA
jgi:hypothetical protein